ncbi:hypothetical protein V3F56_12590, partial [Moorellaceae bacterium AZ2]
LPLRFSRSLPSPSRPALQKVGITQELWLDAPGTSALDLWCEIDSSGKELFGADVNALAGAKVAWEGS